MRILSVYAGNFGSYEYVSFQPEDKGLCLIYGPTGSGKSTLPDIIAWVLYGVTAKNGNVDDVRNWAFPEEETEASVVVETPTGVITIDRVRGGPGKNDLFWIEEGDDNAVRHRGRDLTETQALLSSRLGIDAESFLSAGYFCEFSPPSGFFLANAKERRRLLERTTDLSLPVRLAEGVLGQKKAFKVQAKTAEIQLSRLEGAAEQLRTNLARVVTQAELWGKENLEAVEAEKIKSIEFETTKASKVAAISTRWNAWETANLTALIKRRHKLSALEPKLQKARKLNEPCPTCGVNKHCEDLNKLENDLTALSRAIQDHENAINPLSDQVARVKGEENRSEDRIRDLQAQTNPHLKYLADISSRLEKHEQALSDKQAELASLSERLSALDKLYDLSFTLRGMLLNSAVSSLESKTNGYLEKYFDSEFRVAFSAEDGDSIDVSITKGGRPCVFRQLSKGQRQLLKLCFSVSAMQAVANSCGQTLDQLWFDEALDGLDADLKVKAFSLFESLAQHHGSVFLIDHAPEFQELFTNKYKVSIVGDSSHLEIEQ